MVVLVVCLCCFFYTACPTAIFSFGIASGLPFTIPKSLIPSAKMEYGRAMGNPEGNKTNSVSFVFARAA
jgi:hypothetical protein